MKTLKQKIEVMQACLDGKSIRRINPTGESEEVDMPVWNWVDNDYEVIESVFLGKHHEGEFIAAVFSSYDEAADTLRKQFHNKANDVSIKEYKEVTDD